MAATLAHTNHPRSPRPRLAILLRRVALFLTLGLGTTVALAWTCAILINPRGDPYGPRPRPVRHGWRWLHPQEQAASGYTDRAMGLGRWDAFGSTYFHIEALTLAGTGSNSGTLPPSSKTPEEVAGPLLEKVAMPWAFGLRPWPLNDERAYFGIRGWPLPALWCEYWVDYTPGPGISLGGTPRVRGGLRVPVNDPTSVWYDPPPAPTALPLRPIWPGLLIDTAAFAACWWILITLFTRTRHTLRRRRGQCTRCKYDLRGTPVGSPCPECGRASPN